MQLFPNMRLALLVTVVTVVAGCTSVADMVGYDTETLNESAAKSYLQVLRQAQSKQVLDTSSWTSRRITAVFNRLKPYAERENRTGVPFRWQISVIRSNDLNAWTTPGGKMVMYTGMVGRLHLSDDEIVAVIGYEMTHALLKHSKKVIGRQVLTGPGGSILASATGVDGGLVGLGSDLIATKPFSRYQENEADAGGARLMTQVGYNPQTVVTIWDKMSKVQGGMAVALLSSHPTNETRRQTIIRMLPEVMPIYQRSRSR